jgi:hypothetical protein
MTPDATGRAGDNRGPDRVHLREHCRIADRAAANANDAGPLPRSGALHRCGPDRVAQSVVPD